MQRNQFFRSTATNTLLFSFSVAFQISRIWAESNSTAPVTNDDNDVDENQIIVTSWVWYALNAMILVCFPLLMRPLINQCRHTLKDELVSLQNQFALLAPANELEIKIENPTEITRIPLIDIDRFAKKIETSACQEACALVVNLTALGTSFVGLFVVGPGREEKAGMVLLMISTVTSCISAYMDCEFLNMRDKKSLLEKSHFDFKNTSRDEALRYLNSLSFLSREQPLIVAQSKETPRLVVSPGQHQ